jgi:hypothetical protein
MIMHAVMAPHIDMIYMKHPAVRNPKAIHPVLTSTA